MVGAKNGTEKKRKRTKRKVWKRKINFRRKNFGNLDEWDPDPQMKKVDYTDYTNPKKSLAKDTEGAPLDRVRPSAGGRPAVGQGVQGSPAAAFNLSRVKVGRVNLILSTAEGCPERLLSHTVSETSKSKNRLFDKSLIQE